MTPVVPYTGDDDTDGKPLKTVNFETPCVLIRGGHTATVPIHLLSLCTDHQSHHHRCASACRGILCARRALEQRERDGNWPRVGCWVLGRWREIMLQINGRLSTLPYTVSSLSSTRTHRQMTYHHFVNAAALAFAPYWIFYKARIAAQSEIKSILMGAGFYVIAQFLELITLATFVSGGSEGQSSVEAAGSLLHILQVNVCSNSHNCRSLVVPGHTSKLLVQSRLIGLIHVAGLVLALAMRSTHPRTQVSHAPALAFAAPTRQNECVVICYEFLLHCYVPICT